MPPESVTAQDTEVRAMKDDKQQASPVGVHVTRAAFLQIPLKESDVEVEGLGIVRIRELSGTLRDSFENFAIERRAAAEAQKRKTPDTTGARALIVSLSVVNTETGKLMFGMADVPALREMPGTILNTLFEAIQELNKMGGSEELAKN